MSLQLIHRHAHSMAQPSRQRQSPFHSLQDGMRAPFLLLSPLLLPSPSFYHPPSFNSSPAGDMASGEHDRYPCLSFSCAYGGSTGPRMVSRATWFNNNVTMKSLRLSLGSGGGGGGPPQQRFDEEKRYCPSTAPQPVARLHAVFLARAAPPLRRQPERTAHPSSMPTTRQRQAFQPVMQAFPMIPSVQKPFHFRNSSAQEAGADSGQPPTPIY